LDKGLGNIKTEGCRSLDPLYHALNDVFPTARGSAARALGKIEYSQAKGPLVRTLNESKSEIKDNASSALKKIGWNGSAN
jgi:HEAT repeat protein